MALVLKGAVADFAESVKEYGTAKRILLLALIEADVATTAQFLASPYVCCSALVRPRARRSGLSMPKKQSKLSLSF